MLRSKTGFTLVEVMLCLAVAGILLCVAGPACADLVQRSHAAAARAALLGSITQAVEHAALTGTDVVLCPGVGDTGCRATSDRTSSTSWARR